MNETLRDSINKLVTYLIEGFALVLVIILLFKKNYTIETIIVMGLTAASLFGILDYGAPKIADFARQGAGFGLGFNISGIRGLNMPIPMIP